MRNEYPFISPLCKIYIFSVFNMIFVCSSFFLWNYYYCVCLIVRLVAFISIRNASKMRSTVIYCHWKYALSNDDLLWQRNIMENCNWQLAWNENRGRKYSYVAKRGKQQRQQHHQKHVTACTTMYKLCEVILVGEFTISNRLTSVSLFNFSRHYIAFF